MARESSWVKDYDYDAATRTLRVVTKSGDTYRYHNITAAMHRNIERADSIGSMISLIAGNPDAHPVEKLPAGRTWNVTISAITRMTQTRQVQAATPQEAARAAWRTQGDFAWSAGAIDGDSLDISVSDDSATATTRRFRHRDL
jgi:hypothetical protein